MRRLKIHGRQKLPLKEFVPDHKLYCAFDADDLDPVTEKLKPASVRFPDFSCNWARFSEPQDVQLRPGGKNTDGCYSFRVETARYLNHANPVHDPIADYGVYENYAHVEVRELLPDEGFDVEPPRNRKKKNSTTAKRRLEYRVNISNQMLVEIAAQS